MYIYHHYKTTYTPIALLQPMEHQEEEHKKQKKEKEEEKQRQEETVTLEPSQTPKEPKESNIPKHHPPPSTSSPSPSHDFSFTISLHPSPTSKASSTTTKQAKLDFSPADEIFFAGHLLPLHFLHHSSSISPRPSDFSIENLSLPPHDSNAANNLNPKENLKLNHKPFSSFSNLGKWLLKKKNKMKVFDMARIFKTLFIIFKREKERKNLRGRPYSFSGNINIREREGWKKKRGELSAPASMRTSPTNSGLLVAGTVFSSSDESSMEELQNAIQAAIAHCKNSIAIKEEEKANNC